MGCGCGSRGLGCHWWLRFIMGGGRLICGWVCHRLWTLVAILGSWVVVVGARWSFVSGWAIGHGQCFLFEGYGPWLVVLGHGCWWLAHLWLDRPAFEGGDCRFGLLGCHLGLLCHHSWPGSLLVCHISPLCLRVMCHYRLLFFRVQWAFIVIAGRSDGAVGWCCCLSRVGVLCTHTPVASAGEG